MLQLASSVDPSGAAVVQCWCTVVPPVRQNGPMSGTELLYLRDACLQGFSARVVDVDA